MSDPPRLRRSALYVPADKPRALEKAWGLPADILILDLEDAVAPSRKAEGRRAVEAALAAAPAGLAGKEVLLRVGGLSAAEDFALAERLPLHGIVLPKVEGAAEVQAAAARTGRPLWCMVETPLGVLRAGEIAGCGAALAGLVAGINDLAKALQLRPTPGRAALVPALCAIVLAARAYGLAALDGVHAALDDPDGLAVSCRQGADLGFDGKTLVHPGQIAAANAAFRPDGEAVEHARGLVEAWREAQAAGQGVARYAGTMVEQLHVDEAQRLLALDAAARAHDA